MSQHHLRKHAGRTETRQRWPDFIIIGAARSASSSLYGYLHRHPQIFHNQKKEPCFFCIEEPTQRDVDDYLKLFECATDDELCCEASTPYSRWPQVQGVPRRIINAIPSVKLIYIMRHPVDRAYSQYVHRMTKELFPYQQIPMSFEAHIEEDSLCLDSSLYADQIEQYLAHVPRASMHFLFSDELHAEPVATLRKIFAFLDIDDSFDVTREGLLRINETSHFVNSVTGALVAAGIKRRIPMYALLRRFIPAGLRDAVYRHLRTSKLSDGYRQSLKPVPMKTETRARLLEHFREPNARLEKMLGIDLSRWST